MTTHNICSLGSPTLDLINFARGEAARVVWGRGMLLRFSELYFCAVAKVCIYNTETYIYNIYIYIVSTSMSLGPFNFQNRLKGQLQQHRFVA